MVKMLCLLSLISVCGQAAFGDQPPESSALPVELGPGSSIFQASDHCVAWQATKTMFWLRTLRPVGKSCGVQSTVRRNKDKQLRFIGTFPLHLFDSGEPQRDDEVERVLGADDQPDMIFESSWIAEEDYLAFLKSGTATITGELRFAGRAVSIDVPVKLADQKILYGQYESTFSHFGLTPPSVGWWGLIAQVKDPLVLHFQFQMDQIRVYDPPVDLYKNLDAK